MGWRQRGQVSRLEECDAKRDGLAAEGAGLEVRRARHTCAVPALKRHALALLPADATSVVLEAAQQLLLEIGPTLLLICRILDKVPPKVPPSGETRPSTTLVKLGQNAAVSEYQ
jgi:hypothetical protein